MSQIAYDPVKDKFARIIKGSRILRTIFYQLLDLFFLRSWHVRKVIREHGQPLDDAGKWKLLDAGCGFGQYDRFLLQQFSNIRVTSADVKEDYLEACRLYFAEDVRKGHISFHQQDLLEMESEDRFDFVICIDVLEHIEEDVEVMSNLRRSLKEGGYFLMHSPSHLSEEDAGDDDFFVEEHARAGYSKDDISDKIKKAGLTPVDVSYTYGKYGHTAWELLIKYPMLLLNNTGLFMLPLLAIYYIPVLPVGLMLNWIDLYVTNKTGTGIYALATKEPENAPKVQ